MQNSINANSCHFSVIYNYSWWVRYRVRVSTNTRTGAGVGKFLYTRAGVGFVAGRTLSSGCGFGRVIPSGCVPVATLVTGGSLRVFLAQVAVGGCIMWQGRTAAVIVTCGAHA
jgi:hypothetical protein